MATGFIELTHPDGEKFYVAIVWIQAVEKSDHEYTRGSNAVITLSGEKRAVRESVEQVREKLNG